MKVLAFVLLVSLAMTSAHADGPYVLQRTDGSWVARWVEDQTAREQPTAIGEKIVVAGVGPLPSFEVELRESALTAPSTVALSPNTPLFVMADTHGEFEIAVSLLRAHRIVDSQLRWSFGEGHLVILGDVFDRGAHQTELIWFFYKLESEAQRAGGRVHFILGNHESMVLSGDDRYLHQKYRDATKLLGARSYAELWDATTLLGQWLRSKAAAMKIGNNLCAHGGIAPQAVDRGLTLDAMNGTLRAVLAERQALPPARQALASFVSGPLGPLWYRGYFSDMREQGGPPQATTDDVRRIREHYGVARILVGHTRVPTVTALYSGDVIAVQVYPHRDQSTGAAVMEAIRIDRDRVQRARIDGSLEPL